MGAPGSRFLQGWDAGEGTKTGRLRAFSVPHETLLPGLQFTLAGIIGAPATYYEVPAIRFSYDLLAYLYVFFFPSRAIPDRNSFASNLCTRLATS